MNSILLASLTLGLAAGSTPGPLLTLVISETLLHGQKSGFKVSIAPLITDAPIIIAACFLLSFINAAYYLMIIQVIGALYICYLGFKNITYQSKPSAIIKEPEQSLKKAIIVNFLNPSPYIFWTTVGGPLLKQATLLEGSSFLLSFYVIMVGCKLLLAIAVARSSHFLSGALYQWIIRSTGLLLLIFSSTIFINVIKTLYFKQ